MKTLLLLAALLSAGIGFSQTATLTHRGELCPGGDHPWLSGDVTNSVTHMSSLLIKFTASGGFEVEATNQITRESWTSDVSIFSKTGPFTDSLGYTLWTYPRFENECCVHSNTWMLGSATYSGTWADSTPFNATNTSLMIGGNENYFWDFPQMAGVKANTWFEMNLAELHSANTNFLNYIQGPFSFEGPYIEDTWWDVIVLLFFNQTNSMFNPIPPKTVGVFGSGVKLLVNGHRGTVFSVETSTNLVDWVTEPDIVCDDYGIGRATNAFLLPMKYWRLSYTNSP